MTDIERWLEQNGLGRYAELFTENEVDVSVLPRLSEDDLKELGLPLGARRKLQAAIGQLDQSAPEAISTSLESPTLPTGEAERRQLTVMFCDLMGSVELGERMDVEDYRDLLGRFREAIVGAVGRYDGFVARHQGDGLLIYFGYPQAQENDAERAVRSGLEVVRAVERLVHPYEAELKVRVGIATGQAVVGDLLATGASDRSELAALGPTPNLAARLQAESEPNCVLISETTRQLVSGYFALSALSARELRGLSGETTPHRVVGELAGQTRFSARAGSQLSPFVGREEEMELLHRRWYRVKKGDGQVVLLVGEAGIGKSRLLEQLRTHVMEDAPETFLCQCSPYLVNSALHPIIAALEQSIDTFSGGPDEISRLESWLTQRSQVDEESMGLLADLLSIPTYGRFPDLEALDAQEHRERTLGMLVGHVQVLAAQAPVLCVFEDVHWADPSTRELIGRLVESIEGERVLLVATTRPGFGADWTDLAHAAVLSLSRLPREASEQLAQGIASAIAVLPAEVVERILSRAGGNPLFIEELTRTVVQSGEPARIDTQAIPATLQDSLMARLDASEVGKAVAQCAAVIGRSFGKILLSAVWEGTPERLARGLEALGQSGLLYAQGEGELTRYIFKHALIRDAAYGSLLRERRIALHAKVAKTLEAHHAEARETQPELVAHHLTEAGFIEQAINYWQRAGEQAIQRSANVEAISHFTMALEHLESRPDTPERTRRELRLRVALGPALIAVNGYAAPEVGQTYARAYELCQQHDDDQQLVPVLVGLWLFHLLRVELDTARELGEELLRRAQHMQDPVALLSAHYALGNTLTLLGEFPAAVTHLDHALDLYDPQTHRSLAFLYGEDPGVSCGVCRAWCLWYLGCPDQARQCIRETAATARGLSHPFSLAYSLFAATMLEHLRGEPRPTQEQAEVTMALSSEQGFPFYLALGMILRGWAVAEQGQSREGLGQMRDGLVVYRATGTRWIEPYVLAILAEVTGKAGQVDQGIQVLNEALDVIRATKEDAWKAELYRIKGELLLRWRDSDGRGRRETMAQHPEAEAESCFLQAIETARHQKAKSWELRAATSLARLWRDQGRSQEAHDIVGPVCEWFTEGFDTPDLTGAKSLLEELS